jgi:hypothetical protein
MPQQYGASELFGGPDGIRSAQRDLLIGVVDKPEADKAGRPPRRRRDLLQGETIFMQPFGIRLHL